MRKIRSRVRIDTLTNDPPSSKPGRGRAIYMASLILATLLVANSYALPIFLMRTDGVVTQQRFLVAASHQVQIVQLLVKPGQRVEAGDVVAHVKSDRLVETIAGLSAQVSGQVERLSQLELRRVQLQALLPGGRQKAKDAEDVWQRAYTIFNRGLLTAQRAAELRKAALSSAEEVAQMTAESESLGSRVVVMQEAVVDAQQSIRRLNQSYDDGRLKSPQSGIVGPTVSSSGEVLVPGQAAAEIFAGKRFIFAFLPDLYIFSILPGTKLRIQEGYRLLDGVVTEVLPITDQVPGELQKLFEARRRQQLIRVEFAEEVDIPANTKVRLRSKYDPESLFLLGSRVLGAFLTSG
jgi:multidrug efflux pump subunit AcrA (membrane-fusion protein)